MLLVFFNLPGALTESAAIDFMSPSGFWQKSEDRRARCLSKIGVHISSLQGCIESACNSTALCSMAWESALKLPHKSESA